MSGALFNALSRELGKHFSMGRTRRESLCFLLLGIIQYGTVNLSRVVSVFDGSAQQASNYRRLQRFFQHIHLDAACLARLIVRLTGLEGQDWVLAIDRTTWEFSGTVHNVLLLAIAHKGVAVPVMWHMLADKGRSSMEERKALMEDFLAAFPKRGRIILTGDREFLGNPWLAWLREKNIRFCLRLKENVHFCKNGRPPVQIRKAFASLPHGGSVTLLEPVRLTQKPEDDAPRVRLSVLRLDTGELLILADDLPAEDDPFPVYAKRWQIETLFSALKTRGFRLEDTRMTDPAKISTLIGILSVAFAFAHKVGEWKHGILPVLVKSHGRRAFSFFRYGLETLRRCIAGPPLDPQHPVISLCWQGNLQPYGGK